MNLAQRFYANPILFGRDPAPRLLAFVPRDRVMTCYARRDAGVVTEALPFSPFMLLGDPGLLRDHAEPAPVERLEGDGAFGWLATFASWGAALRAREHCRQLTGHPSGAPEAPYRFFNDPVQQFLLRTGRTSFRGMGFEDLRRLALDIEVTTAPGFEFPNAGRGADRIVAIALADSSGWSTVLSGARASEAQLLAECGRLLRERDPDVLEGHNIFRFDLEYLEARARRHGVPLAWGRDGSLLTGHPSRMQVAERTIGYRRYGVAGRHIVDTWLLSQLYDVGARDLPSYGLKDVARHFGVAAPDRTYLPPEDIPRVFAEDPERLMAYARDDVLETLEVSRLLSAPYFVQAQALPFDYESVVLRGNATKVDALLMREYLYRGQSVPRPGPPSGVAGGYTAVFCQGVARDVLHADVTSLYPSIMLSQGIAPSADRLGIWSSLLGDLREFRVSAKRLARTAADPGDRLLLGALQQTFKILINSFYGYLGFSLGHWNDFEAANRVTLEGRRVVMSLVDRLRELGGTVIEVDTDGLYFVPPPEGPDEDSLLASLAGALPSGIELELSGRYGAMFSYKMKNYALLDDHGKLLIKGSGFRSRGIELFQRQWMEEVFRLLLDRPAGGDPGPRAPLGGELPGASGPGAAVHEDGDAAGVARGLSREGGGGKAEPGGALRAGAGRRTLVPGRRPGVLLRGGRQTGEGERGGQAGDGVGPVGARREHRALHRKAPGPLREVPPVHRARRAPGSHRGRRPERARPADARPTGMKRRDLPS